MKTRSQSRLALEVERALKQKYKTVSFKDAQANPEFWQVLNNMFREQAARIIQRKWRSTHQKTFNSKYSETLNTPLSLRFIKEPWGIKSSEHAAKINQGKWLELEFKEPEFVRNIYKALHNGKININQMSTALLLHDASTQFKDAKGQVAIKQHSFNKPGPYNPTIIKYITQQNLDNFKKNLTQIPATENCYFSINFPPELEVVFLYLSITWNKENFFGLHEYLKKYIQKQNIHNSLKIELLDSIKLDEANEFNVKKIIEYIKGEAKKIAPKLFDATEKKDADSEYTRDYESIMFLIAILRVHEQMPAVSLSPDYNEKNSHSPLLSMILPSISAFNALHQAVHGEKDVTFPFFSSGQFGTRLIRNLDEKPMEFKLETQHRPVELTHPDLKPNPTPHDAKSHNFLLSWHDLFHCWRNGANMYKPFFRYLRQLLTTEKGFDMSKSIWELTDMDYAYGHRIRTALEHESHLKTIRLKRDFIEFIIKTAAGLQDKSINRHSDNTLLLMVDMHINREKWIKLSGCRPEQLFSDSKFQSRFKKIGKLINNDFKKNKTFKSHKFYILTYRMSKKVESAFSLCERLESIGLNKFLYWDKNGDLFLQPRFVPSGTTVSIDDDNAYKFLSEAITSLIGLKTEKHHTQSVNKKRKQDTPQEDAVEMEVDSGSEPISMHKRKRM